MTLLPDSLLALWLTFLGAAVGSFLNVVIYRVPAGMSIVKPNSHCPFCKHPIRWYDNVPVLSWIWLRARCRDCRTPISIRYPLVEAGTAALFLLMALHEIFRSSANLPPPLASGEGGPLLVPRSLPQVFGVYAYHMLLLSTLLAAILVACDGKRVPLQLFLPALVTGLLAPLAWPDLRPVAAWPSLSGQSWTGLIDGAAGLLAGAGLGALGWAGRRAAPPSGRYPHPLASGCVGVFLGWQAVMVIVVVTVIVDQILRLAARRLAGFGRVPAIAWLGLGTLAWLLAWPQIAPWLAKVHLAE